MSKSKQVYKDFPSNGVFVAPAGVYLATIYAYGAGGAGGKGDDGLTTADKSIKGGSGGGGATPYTIPVILVPGTSYTVTIGQGLGYQASGTTTKNTTFVGGSLNLVFEGAGDAEYSGASSTFSSLVYRPGSPTRDVSIDLPSPYIVDSATNFFVPYPGLGGYGGARLNIADNVIDALKGASAYGYLGGQPGSPGNLGTVSGPGGYSEGGGGGGGAAGPGGNGGNGGNGGDGRNFGTGTGGSGTAGQNAPANSGAGGGGGGGGGCASTPGTGGAGGLGGSGFLRIIWIE